MSNESEDGGTDYLLSLHLSKVGYDNGYWITIRATRVEPDEGRPHGLQYALTLHDENDDRILGYDNSHAVDVGTGPARRSRRPSAFDHVDRRGRRSVPYAFTMSQKLLEDFLAEVDEILNRKHVP